MPEFTGNIHSLQITLPFPTPSGAGTFFVIGRTFGDPAAGADGMDIWVNDDVTTSYDPPDGDPILDLQLHSLLACVHGWLQFVPEGQQALKLKTRTGSPLLVGNDALVLSVWPTLRDNFEQMFQDGSVLAPSLEQGKGGRPALEHLIYENVTTASLKPDIKALIAEARPDPLFNDAQREEMATKFMSGELRILARAGRIIGRAAGGAPTGATKPADAGDSWRRISLRAVDRLGQLIDPGYFLRRVHELHAVTEIPLIVDKTLIPSREAIANHPLPDLTVKRQIVDLRDEHGNPKPAMDFYLDASIETATPKQTNEWGLWIGPPLGAGGDPLAVETKVVAAMIEEGDGIPINPIALGTLPNAARSAFRLPRQLLADDYLTLSVFDLAAWFPARPTPGAPTEDPLRRFTQGNRVTPLVDGRDTFWEIYKALRRAFRDENFTGLNPGSNLPADGPLFDGMTLSNHRIYIAGWRLIPNMYLRDLPEIYLEVDFDESGVETTGSFDPHGHLMGVLRAAIDAGVVETRALLWRQLQPTPDFHSNNSAAARRISAPEPRRGQAIVDEVCRTTGSHHQKAVVIHNRDGRVAFIGGIDLALGRWDTPEHIPNEPRSQSGRNATPANPWTGWHDVHCRIDGPAVDDVEKNFRQRWNHNPNRDTGGRTLTPAPATPTEPIPGASHFVQINRTIPPGLAAYQFVSSTEGDHGIRDARLNAITKARRYIYIEDQYLTMVDLGDLEALMADPDPINYTPSNPETIAAALRKRLVGADPVEFVAILLPKRLEEEPAFANMVLYELRRRFIKFITHGLTDEQKRERLLVFHLRNNSGVPTYVHAKTMMVDDLWCSIGSSNINYRSTTYDGEINCDVVDGAIERGVRPLARDLRVRLWAEHLQLQPNERYLVKDPRQGFELLRLALENPGNRPHHLQPYDLDFYGDDFGQPGAPPPYNPANSDHEIVRLHLVDPDGRDPDDPLFDYAALLELIQGL